jgi:hypothetical protein
VLETSSSDLEIFLNVAVTVNSMLESFQDSFALDEFAKNGLVSVKVRSLIERNRELASNGVGALSVGCEKSTTVVSYV